MDGSLYRPFFLHQAFTANPVRPLLMSKWRSKDKAPYIWMWPLNFAFASKQNPGHVGRSLKAGRRAGYCFFCESARRRSEPYPKRARKRKAEFREIFFIQAVRAFHKKQAAALFLHCKVNKLTVILTTADYLPILRHRLNL